MRKPVNSENWALTFGEDQPHTSFDLDLLN